MHIPTEIVDIAIENLILYARNARTHSDEQVAELEATGERFDDR